MYDIATQAKLQLWRRKALDNTLTIEEMVEAAALLRAGRTSAQVASTTAKGTRAKAAKAAQLPDADSMLDEMMGEGP